MLHEDERGATALHLPDQGAYALGFVGVEAGHRLIQEDQPGGRDKGAGQFQAFLLAVREGAGKPVGTVRQAKCVQGLQVGEPARVLPTGTSDAGLGGRIEYIREVVDPQRRMVEVRVRVPNTDHALRPNAFVQVAFVPTDTPRIVVPAEAVVTDDQQSFVFVRDGSHLDRREVVLGRQRGGRAEVLQGLAPGETYVTKGAILLLNAVDLANQ